MARGKLFLLRLRCAHVSLIDDEETSQIMYTLDEGENWRKIEFKEFGMNVDSFVTELSGEERYFLFIGTSIIKGHSVGMIGAINFSRIFKRVCRGIEEF